MNPSILKDQICFDMKYIIKQANEIKLHEVQHHHLKGSRLNP